MALNLVSASNIALNALQVAAPANATYPFLTNPPNATVKVRTIGIKDRWIIFLDEKTRGVITLSMRDSEERRDQKLTAEARSEADLKKIMGAWAGKADWWRGRLTIFRLQPNTAYRVLKSIWKDFPAGSEVAFTRQNYVPYDGMNFLEFQGRYIRLHEESDEAILDNFDLYFAPLS